jgi:hypothetical protein
VREKTHVDSIIEGTVLSDGTKHRLMVGSGVDGGQAVSSSGETLGDISSEDTTCGWGVQTPR